MPFEALGGGEFYDDEGVFAVYTAHRASPNSPNELIEGPAFVDLLGRVVGLRVLDLGCGDGRFGRWLLDEAGCAAYRGLDASERMLALARQTLAGTRGQLQYAHIEAFEVPAFEGFDVVVSRLALHYVEDLPSVLRRVHRALVAGGRLVLSVEHPVITSCDRGWGGRGPRADWLVDDYFVTGRRETSWLGGRVVKFHRTIEDYLVALESAGFAWEALREPGPQRPAFAPEAEFRRRQRIPLFLLLAARRLDEPASAVATEEGA